MHREPILLKMISEKNIGIAFMIVAMFLFTNANALYRVYDPQYSIIQIVFFLNLISFLIIVFFLLISGRKINLRSKFLYHHILRGCIGSTSTYCLLKSLQLLPFAEASMLITTSPLFIAVFSFKLLNEKANFYHWIAVCTGFIGIIIILSPEHYLIWNIGSVLALSAAIFEAFIQMNNRFLGSHENSLSILLNFNLYSLIFCSLFLPFTGESIGNVDLVFLFFIGIFVALGQLAVIKAYQLAKAPVIGPFNFAAMVFSIFYGFLFFNEQITLLSLAGALLISASGIYLIYFEEKSSLLEAGHFEVKFNVKEKINS